MAKMAPIFPVRCFFLNTLAVRSPSLNEDKGLIPGFDDRIHTRQITMSARLGMDPHGSRQSVNTMLFPDEY